jgi:hypothetical protein
MHYYSSRIGRDGISISVALSATSLELSNRYPSLGLRVTRMSAGGKLTRLIDGRNPSADERKRRWLVRGSAAFKQFCEEE